MDNITINNNNIHSGHVLKSDDDGQMDMMMNGIFQMPNDIVLNSAELYQNPDHHHYMSSYTNDNSYLPASASSLPPLIPAVRHPRRGFVDGDGGGNGSPSMAAMREMIFRIAVMQPVHIDPESIKAPKRRNVRISKDPQSVAARHRRERISERIRILQRLVPGGTKMDTASMLDEAIHYVKFLKTQVQSLETASSSSSSTSCSSSSSDSVSSIRSPPEIGFPVAMSTGAYVNPHHHKGFGSSIQLAQNVQHFGDMIID